MYLPNLWSLEWEEEEIDDSEEEEEEEEEQCFLWQHTLSVIIFINPVIIAVKGTKKKTAYTWNRQNKGINMKNFYDTHAKEKICKNVLSSASMKEHVLIINCNKS